MPRMTFTDKSIRGLATEGRARYWDASLPGFGIRVSASTKTWIVLYKTPGRVQMQLKLGTFPAMSLATARAEAKRKLGAVHAGGDPASDRLARRASDANTVGRVYETYAVEAERLRSWPEIKRICERQILPAWKARPIGSITRADVRALIAAKAAKAPIAANRLHAQVSRLFSYALQCDLIPANPCAGLPKPHRERARERVLTSQELSDLWTDLEGPERAGLPEHLRDLLLLLLLGGQRLGETSRMQWQHLDLDAGVWTIPSTLAKNGIAHRVPLTPRMQEVIGRRPARAPEHYVFASGSGYSSPYFRARKAGKILSARGFKFHLHDLRRTVATGMAGAGVPRDHVARVLNHRSLTHSTVTAVYDRHGYDAEKRAALDAWDAAIALATSGERGKVLRMTGR